MASIPITSWEIDGETMEIETDFIFEDSKITDKSYCSLKIKKKKKSLILGRKDMTNVDRILKSITLPKKACIVKLWFFQYSCMDVRVGS